MTNIGARRSKSLEKEKEHSIHEGCRVTGLLAPKSGCPGLSQLYHTKGLNLGRILFSLALIKLSALVCRSQKSTAVIIANCTR